MSDFPDYHQFKSAMDAQTPAFVKKLCRVLAYIFFILPALMLFLPGHTWSRFVGWLLAGIAFYFLYSIRHSKLAATSAG